MIDKETVLITGGSGFIGSYLTKHLENKGFEVRILSRTITKKGFYHWNPDMETIDESAFFGLDHIIHLAGASIADKKWTKKRKKVLIDSRVKSTSFLLSSLEKHKHSLSLKSIVCTSAIGFYGNRGDKLLTERDKVGDDFLAEVCQQWEHTTKKLAQYAPNFNIVRIGLVLAKDGGALPKMLMTKTLGVLNYFGNGQQYYSWIHIKDLVGIFTSLLHKNQNQEVYNAVAPNPIRNKAFIESIATTSKRAIVVPIPSWALRLIMGEMADVVLNSNNVSSAAIQQTGYQFVFPELKNALEDLL